MLRALGTGSVSIRWTAAGRRDDRAARATQHASIARFRQRFPASPLSSC